MTTHKTDLTDQRKDYVKGELSKGDVPSAPLQLFSTWFDEVCSIETHEAYAMTLATCHAGRPSARIVLLRAFSEEGFEFYTNYESRKGQDLAANPQAEILFFWPSLERQVRLFGRVEKVSEAQSLEYFHSRPRESQLAALVSCPQSAPVDSRAQMQETYDALAKRYPDEVPRPASWGGYRLIPEYAEFWQGRAGRMHDRLVYELRGSSWSLQRILP